MNIYGVNIIWAACDQEQNTITLGKLLLKNTGSTRIHIIESHNNVRHQAFYKFVSLNSLHVLACFVVLPENILWTPCSCRSVTYVYHSGRRSWGLRPTHVWPDTTTSGQNNLFKKFLWSYFSFMFFVLWPEIPKICTFRGFAPIPSYRFRHGPANPSLASTYWLQNNEIRFSISPHDSMYCYLCSTQECEYMYMTWHNVGI